MDVVVAQLDVDIGERPVTYDGSVRRELYSFLVEVDLDTHLTDPIGY